MTNTTAASKYIPRRPRISINWNPPFQTSLHKISKVVFFRLTKFFFRNKIFFSKEQLLFSFLCIVKQKKISERSEKFWKFSFLKIYSKKNIWKVGFQFMLILGLLGMYFDASWYLSQSPHFYSNWLWPYCETLLFSRALK